MNYIDILIIVFAVLTMIRGHQIGMIRQLASTLGFAAGVAMSIPITSMLSQLITEHNSRVLVTTICLFVLSFGMMLATERFGLFIRERIKDGSMSHKIDLFLGGLVSIFTFTLGIWVITAFLTLLPSSELNRTLRNSTIISYIDRTFPPASELMANLNRLVDPNDLPLVFSTREPSPEATMPLPPLTDFEDAINQAKKSVVRINGIGCGGIVNGTGFVYAKNRVITNAHVVAGVSSPKIHDDNGTHEASVIYFDPLKDVAVLSSSNLVGEPLATRLEPLQKGETAVVMGYPGGGKEQDQVVGTLDILDALGRDIYGAEKSVRNVYILQANLIPGNSGGPVIDKTGAVVGIVFGTSTTYNDIGYALTLPQVIEQLYQAQYNTSPVSVGQCSAQ